MSDGAIVKIGHTVQSDMRVMKKSLKKDIQMRGLMDLSQLLKKFYRN